MELQDKIEELTGQLTTCSNNISLLIERGKAYYKAGENDKAINDFISVTTIDPQNREATVFIELMQNIFDFSYNERLNL